MLKKTIALLLNILGLLSMQGCIGDPMQSRYTRIPNLNRADLVGDYAPANIAANVSNKTSPLSGIHSSSINIWLDRFTVGNIPDSWRDPSGRGQGHLDSGTGTWSLTREQNKFWIINLKFEKANFNADGCSCAINILGSQAPFSLYFRVGDPDTGQGLEYIKLPVSE